MFLELKNAIETKGGFIEVQLNKNLLQVRLQYFLDVLVAISEEEDRQKIKDTLENTIKKNNYDINFDKRKTIGQTLANEAPDMALTLIEALVPKEIGVVSALARHVFNAIKESRK